MIVVISCGIFFTFKPADEALCKESQTGTPYCRYKGTIKQFYINSDNLLLVFLNDDFNLVNAKNLGYDLKASNIMALTINSENENIFTALVLAFEHQYPVEIHARDTEFKYIKIDRVWIKGSSRL
jgi:hypothetical protein